MGVPRARERGDGPIRPNIKRVERIATPRLYETKIVLPVGSELRIKNNGDMAIDHPELESVGDNRTRCWLTGSIAKRGNTFCGGWNRWRTVLT